MATGKRNNHSMTDEESLNLKKNRISSIEVNEGITLQKKKFAVKPIIILSSIAAALVIGILVATKYFFKKPEIFTPSSNNLSKPFDSIEKDIKGESENIHIIRGRESYSKKYLNDAVAEFNEVVESDASDNDKAIALANLGMISDDRGDYDKAIEYYTRALTYNKKNPDVYKYLSLAYRHKKDYERAVDSAKESISIDPSDIDTKILLGNIYFELARFDDAINQYREVLEKSPGNAAVCYNMASAMLKKGDEFGACEYFKKAGAADRIGEIAHKAYSRLGIIYTERRVFDEAEKYLKQAVFIRPNDAINRYNLGIAYLRQNKKKEAAGELEQAERLGENNYEILEKIGEAYFSIKDFNKSLDIYNRIKKTNRRNVKILNMIAGIYYEKGELDKAFEAYKRITLIEPITENARIAYLNMGNILDDMQRFDEAIEAYQKALSISPKDEATYINLGLAYKHAAKPELAISSWKKAQELNPQNPRPLLAIADYYYEKNFYDLAEKEYQKVISRWPNIQEPHFKMATIYYKRGKYAYALRAYKKVLEINESSDLARKSYINSAILISKSKTDEESLEKSTNFIQKALLLKPGDSEALFSLGVIYLRKDMADRAIDIFYQVIKSTRDVKLLSESYNYIGQSYYKKRKYKKALQSFTRGIEEDPSNEEIRMNRKVAAQAYEHELGKD